MQASVGGSVEATIDRLIGTVGGAVAGVAVAYLVPHQSLLTLGPQSENIWRCRVSGEDVGAIRFGLIDGRDVGRGPRVGRAYRSF